MRIDVKVDGAFGPQTAQAAAPDHLADAYAIARRNYWYGLAESQLTSRRYARRQDRGKGGWTTRAEAFMEERYRLTDAQHRARVAKWT
jgi:hypothetical protein